ncbi:MAG: cell division protein FtsL [Oscillospiraceae bacterium]|nr:cell division protein FtsL [Oscillospiraceae bacterium]
MTRYSSYRPKVEPVITEERQTADTPKGNSVTPLVLVGAAVAAALMVLLLLTQSQLSQMSFEISALEQKLKELETQHEKLLISHAGAYRLDRIEDRAVNELGMVHPNTDQIRYIEINTADSSRKEPE